jgi:hypothetical protein
MGGHGNFAFNLVVKLSVGCFYKFEVINSVMSGALLSVLLVCNMSGTLVTEIKQCVQR